MSVQNISAGVQVAQAILALIPLAGNTAAILLGAISQIRQSAQQTGEWTPEAEAAYQARLLAKADSPEAQPDAPEVTGTGAVP